MSVSLFSPPIGDVLLVPVWPNAGAPTSGTSGTLAGYAQPGDLLADTTNKNLYQNTGTQASPTWTQFSQLGEAGSFTTLAASGAVSGAGFVALLASPTGPIGSSAPVAITGTTITADTDFSGPTVGVASGADAAAGQVGEVIGGTVLGNGTTATVTITIAAPGVVTWTGHGFSSVFPQPVVFTTTGGLPTGLTAGTVYYVVPSSVTTNTFEVATTVANALAGTAVTTTGTQSGTQTGTAGTALSTTATRDVTGLALSAGDWDVWGQLNYNASGATTTLLEGGINTTSATLPSVGSVVGGSLSTFAGPTMTTVNVLPSLQVPQCQINLATAGNVFLSAEGTFSAGTIVASGFLFARRRR